VKLSSKAALLIMLLTFSTAAVSAAEWQRVDFKMLNAGCAACLFRIEKSMLSSPGVKKAALMYIAPYAGCVVYDAKLTTWPKIQADASHGEVVKFKTLKMRAVDKIPAVLIPDKLRFTPEMYAILSREGVLQK